MLKIISGKLKGRSIPVIKNASFKPSASRTREAIFSIINSWQFDCKLAESNFLDVCCGSGSVGIEALSRGANNVCFIDHSFAQLGLLKSFIEKLEYSDQASFMHASIEHMPYANRKYEIVFIDPPYFTDLADIALLNLKKKCWLVNGAIIILELAHKQNIDIPDEYVLLDVRVYGNNKLLFLKYSCRS